ncbi:hypothetical protein K501DRAFT_189532 [Backusella circina FSU 941]|nr:hypothetical protein K501DRAFT_189532 [Backusella circina FSU 941]
MNLRLLFSPVSFGMYDIHPNPTIWENLSIFNPDRFAPEYEASHKLRKVDINGFLLVMVCDSVLECVFLWLSSTFFKYVLQV